jgi:hypothetical protein
MIEAKQKHARRTTKKPEGAKGGNVIDPDGGLEEEPAGRAAAAPLRWPRSMQRLSAELPVGYERVQDARRPAPARRL